VKRNEIYTPYGTFPMREGIYEANKKMSDLEVLENLFIFGDMVVPEVLTEALYRELVSGGETKSEINAKIHEMKTGQKPEQHNQTMMNLISKMGDGNV
jgi:hypothetical protein